jgi:hypothetical protein
MKMEFYSAIKKEIMLFAKRQTELDISMLHEIKPVTQRQVAHIFSWES